MNKKNLFYGIAEAVAIQIINGDIKDNISISENQLMESYDVSRTSVREAIKLLESKGLVNSKTKIGTIVSHYSKWNFLDETVIKWVSKSNKKNEIIQHFYFFRKSIEPVASSLAATYRKKEHLLKMEEILSESKKLISNFDVNKWLEYDIIFHKTIFEATSNYFFLSFSTLCEDILRITFNEAAKEGDMCLDLHELLYLAIKNKNEQQARYLALSLIENSSTKITI